MAKRALPIRVACPKGERWKDMALEDGGRRCLRCDRHLVDLSALTEAQVDDFARRVRGEERVCATVSLDSEGAPIYRRRAVRRLVQTAAGVVMSVSLAACSGEAEAPRASEGEPVTAAEPAAEPVAEAEAAAEPESGPESEPEAEPESEPESVAETGESEDETVSAPARERPRRRGARRREGVVPPEDQRIVGLFDK